jgi:hypothetical protein
MAYDMKAFFAKSTTKALFARAEGALRKLFTSVVLAASLLLLPATAQAIPVISTSPSLPPTHCLPGANFTFCAYRAVQPVTYTNVPSPFGPVTVVLDNIFHFGGPLFSDDFRIIVRAASGGNTLETFNSTLTAMASINGNPAIPFSLTGSVQIMLFGYNDGDLGTFNTEMVSMLLTDGGTTRVRESPTLASLGQTSIADIGGGFFAIDSFFDVFTELSLDSGANWTPSQTSERVITGVPEPGTLSLLGIGVIAIRLIRRRRAA